MNVKKTKRKPETPLPLPKIKIKIIGIGGGGGSIITEISRYLKKSTFVIADTDWKSLKKSSNISRFYFGQNLTKGLGTGMNPELAKMAAEKEKEKISRIFSGQDISILVASLGGGVGSGAGPVFAEMAQKSKTLTLGIFTLPFKFEGAIKANIAQKALESFKNYLNALIVIPNERIFKVIDEKTPISTAFSAINKNLLESLISLIEIIYNPGLINIDFADIRTILNGRGKIAFLNTVRIKEKEASEKIIKNIFRNPFYSFSLKPEKILLNIAGGDNLSMVDLEKITKAVADSAQKAKIIFGISKNPEYKNQLKVTLLMTGEPLIVNSGVGKKIKNIEKKKDKKEKINKKKIKKFIPEKKEIQKIKKEKKEIKEKEKFLEKLKKPKKREIRRNALEIKKEEQRELEEKLNQEKEWEIPAFLRKLK